MNGVANKKESCKLSFFLLQKPSIKRTPAPVPWIKVNQNRESSEMKTENEQLSVLDRVCQNFLSLK